MIIEKETFTNTIKTLAEDEKFNKERIIRFLQTSFFTTTKREEIINLISNESTSSINFPLNISDEKIKYFFLELYPGLLQPISDIFKKQNIDLFSYFKNINQNTSIITKFALNNPNNIYNIQEEDYLQIIYFYHKKILNKNSTHPTSFSTTAKNRKKFLTIIDYYLNNTHHNTNPIIKILKETEPFLKNLTLTNYKNIISINSILAKEHYQIPIKNNYYETNHKKTIEFTIDIPHLSYKTNIQEQILRTNFSLLDTILKEKTIESITPTIKKEYDIFIFSFEYSNEEKKETITTIFDLIIKNIISYSQKQKKISIDDIEKITSFLTLEKNLSNNPSSQKTNRLQKI